MADIPKKPPAPPKTSWRSARPSASSTRSASAHGAKGSAADAAARQGQRAGRHWRPDLLTGMPADEGCECPVEPIGFEGDLFYFIDSRGQFRALKAEKDQPGRDPGPVRGDAELSEMDVPALFQAGDVERRQDDHQGKRDRRSRPTTSRRRCSWRARGKGFSRPTTRCAAAAPGPFAATSWSTTPATSSGSARKAASRRCRPASMTASFIRICRRCRRPGPSRSPPPKIPARQLLAGFRRSKWARPTSTRSCCWAGSARPISAAR
jgi:hypothetical protein